MPENKITVETAIKHQLEAIIREKCEASNARDWDPASPAWRHFHPRFQYDASGGYGGDTVSALEPSPNLPPSSSSQDTSLAASLKLRQEVAAAHPHARLRLLDVTCTGLNTTSGHGAVMMSTEVIGMADGVVRMNVMMYDFRRIEDVWMVLKCTTMPGLDSSGLNAGL